MKINQQIIFSEAKDILLKQGYDGLTFSKLSKKLGVTRPALYKHYNNKDTLIIDLMVNEMTLFLKDFDCVSPPLNSNWIDDILSNFINFGSIHRLFSSLYRIDYESEEGQSEKMAFLKSQHVKLSDKINDLLEIGKTNNIIRSDINNKTITQFIMISVDMLSSDSTTSNLTEVKELITTGIGINK